MLSGLWPVALVLDRVEEDLVVMEEVLSGLTAAGTLRLHTALLPAAPSCSDRLLALLKAESVLAVFVLGSRFK